MFGTSQSNLAEVQEYRCDGTSSTSGSFSKVVGSLNANTTYYYQAYVMEYDAAAGEYVMRTGAVKSFKTATTADMEALAFLTNYEVPAVSATTTDSGDETYSSDGSNDKWYKVYTSNSNRAVVTHTFTYGGARLRNYTVMMDATKKAPLWTAHAMHSSTWPDKNVGRNEAWTDDPAFPSSWQQDGVSGYSKGHLVASNYRQTLAAQNKQTFYYSNQAPQIQNGFNGDIWNTLENQVVGAVPSGRDTLYVTTGVLYENSTSVSGVPIPSHFYKCLMKCTFSSDGTMTGAQGIAFVYSNVSHAGDKYYDAEYVSSIDDIELRAGFDFFANVPGNLQSSAEANTSHTWFSGVASNGNISGVTDDNWGDL